MFAKELSWFGSLAFLWVDHLSQLCFCYSYMINLATNIIKGAMLCI